MVKRFIIYGVLAVAIVVILAFFFTTDYAQDYCARGIIGCLQEGAQLEFWDKIMNGFSCLWANTKCVLGL